jgi:hypothetical protein
MNKLAPSSARQFDASPNPLGSLTEGLDAGPETEPRTERREARRLRRAIMPVTAIVLFAVAAGIAWQTVGRGPDLAAGTRKSTLIDSVSGEVFVDYRVPDGSSLPLRNPRTGEDTLYPAESCQWTADGKAKWEPTYVYIPYDVDSVTCPDCGRTVIPHNPRPPDELMLEALERHKAGG